MPDLDERIGQEQYRDGKKKPARQNLPALAQGAPAIELAAVFLPDGQRLRRYGLAPLRLTRLRDPDAQRLVFFREYDETSSETQFQGARKVFCRAPKRSVL
jgi:hypothetical protein